ncbi:hypothetical protein UlMin_022753 [Ulmus minor]
MALNPNHDALKCRLFGITLGSHARTWYVNLPQGSIGSFSQLADKFTSQFSSCEPIRRPTEILHKVVQGPGESLREYISRFTRAALTVTDFNDQTGRSVFLANIHPSKQYKYLLSHQNSQSFSALMDAAASHALTEEKLSPLAESTTSSARPPRPSVPRPRSDFNVDRMDRADGGRRANRDFDQNQYPRRREDHRPRPYDLVAQQPRRPDHRVERRPTPSKFDDYAALVYNLEHVFQVDNRNKIPAPRPLRNTGKNLDLNSPVPITFTEDEGKRLHHPHFDALVINLEIEKHKVMRNLIDNGSSADIIFARALDQLDLPDKTLRPVKNSLRGFAGNEVVPLGQIALKVTFGTFPKCVTVNVNFIVVDSPSVYNTIIGRITQHLIQGVASTYHLLMKFPTPYGIGVCEGIQTLSR